MFKAAIRVIVFLFAFFLNQVFAQHTYVPLGSLSNHILDRLEILSGTLQKDYHTALKSYRRQAIAEFTDSFPVATTKLSKCDYFNLSYLQADNFEFSNSEATASNKPVLKEIYKRKAALYSVQIPDFNLVVNPVLYYEFNSSKSFGPYGLINNRGVEIRGNITNRIGFYTQVSDEILFPMGWVQQNRDLLGYYPGASFVKGYDTYVGYFVASGYVTASLNKYMDLQFGHYRNFIGDGLRTFILGSHIPENLNLRLNTRIWKLNYTNIWSELRDYPVPVTGTGRESQPRKYTATHHLSINLTKRLNIGIFETIIFQRDSGHNTPGYDLNYLNPIIFYKAVENGLNSVDKAVMGMNFKYNFMRHFSWYGQIVISEFVLKEMLARSGWWGNKYAIQTGLKYIDALGIKNLDLQGEFNMARPFMYTSYNSQQAFTHFRQPVAHPLGANFYEGIGIIRYQPLNRLFVTVKAIYARYGNDTLSSNWGRNIGLGYTTNPPFSYYNNTIAQGVLTNLYHGELLVTYMPKHNLFLDFRAGYRRTSSVLKQFEFETAYFALGVRLNITQRFYDF
jgi:hypothetical protein